MATLIVICLVLATYGFTIDLQRDYLINYEGLDCWDAFTMVVFEDFGDIAKTAAKWSADPFTISVVKLKALKALIFLIEYKQQINKTVQHELFTQPILSEYVRLPAITTAVEKNIIEFIVRP